MKAVLYVNGIVGEDTNLLDVIRQFKSFESPSEVMVIINSVGGSVDEGQSIFSYLRNLQIPITTYAKQAYSIATAIFMAGDTRIVEDGDEKLMIHMPWASVQGGSEDLEYVAKELKAIEKEFIKFYSNYTSIDEGSIKQLLQNETFLSGQEALDMGLATELKAPLKAVAFYNQEDKEEKQMTKAERFLKALTDFFKEDVEINALILQDANGVEINFPELEEGEEPQVGDKAEIDGSPASGELVLPNGDTWVFEAGELKEVIPSESEEEDVEASDEDVEGEDEIQAEETVEGDDEIDIEAIIEKIENSITEKLQKQNKKLRAEIKAMKKLIGSEDAEVQAQETITNTSKSTSNYLTGVLRK